MNLNQSFDLNEWFVWVKLKKRRDWPAEPCRSAAIIAVKWNNSWMKINKWNVWLKWKNDFMSWLCNKPTNESMKRAGELNCFICGLWLGPSPLRSGIPFNWFHQINLTSTSLPFTFLPQRRTPVKQTINLSLNWIEQPWARISWWNWRRLIVLMAGVKTYNQLRVN